MNSRQRLVLLIGAAILIAFCSYPPWMRFKQTELGPVFEPLGRHWIWKKPMAPDPVPTFAGVRIYTSKLAPIGGLILLVTFVSYHFAGKRRKDDE